MLLAQHHTLHLGEQLELVLSITVGYGKVYQLYLRIITFQFVQSLNQLLRGGKGYRLFLQIKIKQGIELIKVLTIGIELQKLLNKYTALFPLTIVILPQKISNQLKIKNYIAVVKVLGSLFLLNFI
jgi:hypothetical protein